MNPSLDGLKENYLISLRRTANPSHSLVSLVESLPGDFGFDSLGLGEDTGSLRCTSKQSSYMLDLLWLEWKEHTTLSDEVKGITVADESFLGSKFLSALRHLSMKAAKDEENYSVEEAKMNISWFFLFIVRCEMKHGQYSGWLKWAR